MRTVARPLVAALAPCAARAAHGVGGIDALRTMAARNVGTIAFLDGVAAAARHGVGHATGAKTKMPVHVRTP